MKSPKLVSFAVLIQLTVSLAFFPAASMKRCTRVPISARRYSGLGMTFAAEDVDPKETAILLIEYQNEFTRAGGKLHDAVKECMEHTKIIENSKALVDFSRNIGCRIIHIPISFERGHAEIADSPYGILKGVKQSEAFTNGEWGAGFDPSMKPASGDLVVKGKSGLCGFHSTNLNFLLSQHGIKNVAIGGFLTNCCVESTMRTAYENGYRVYTLRDCSAATSISAHENAFDHNFGMFSIPITSLELMDLFKAPSISSYAVTTSATTLSDLQRYEESLRMGH